MFTGAVQRPKPGSDMEKYSVNDAIKPTRAFCRIATSYVKEKDYKKAIDFFDKSLAEHRLPETLKKKQEVGSYNFLQLVSFAQRFSNFCPAQFFSESEVSQILKNLPRGVVEYKAR